MIHLFKKVYVVSDQQLDLSYDRIVISKENGVKLRDAAQEVYQGNLVAFAKTTDGLIPDQFDSWDDMFQFANGYAENSGKKFFIYCDNEALLEVLCAWFNSILPNSTKDSLGSLLRGVLFRYNAFYKGRVSINSGNSDRTVEITMDGFDAAYEKTKDLEYDVSDEVKGYAGVEFLLATYLTSGKKKKELKDVLKVLIKKDLEKFLFEVKEIFFTHFMTRRFSKKLGFEKDYTYDNLFEILEDKSKFADVFLTDRIWTYKYMSHASTSNSSVDLKGFTDKDIAAIREFVVHASACWPEEGGYIGPKSDVSKLDFLPIFTSFTDAMLDKIIETESEFVHAAGSFFSIDLASVNHYLIEEILQRNTDKDTDWIKQYSLVL